MPENRERDGTVIIILKNPGEPAIPTFMGVELEDMQKAIGGGHVTNAQIHRFGLLDDVVCMVDEDARMKQLTPNLRLGGPFDDAIFGPCYFCSMNEKYELISLTNLQTEAITSWMHGREL